MAGLTNDWLTELMTATLHLTHWSTDRLFLTRIS